MHAVLKDIRAALIEVSFHYDDSDMRAKGEEVFYPTIFMGSHDKSIDACSSFVSIISK